MILSDRGNLVVCLLSIQKILQQFNVKNVRLRPHPSENINWYMKFLDKDFFISQAGSLSQSLSKTSLVIGPVSTVFFEALYYKTNYLVYEPSTDNINILNHTIEPPFDKSENRIPVAYDEVTLFKFLKEKNVRMQICYPITSIRLLM